eukprot:SAG11_NODE_1365_length_5109_cov_2.411976_7_plen_57_part_00
MSPLKSTAQCSAMGGKPRPVSAACRTPKAVARHRCSFAAAATAADTAFAGVAAALG